MPESVMAGDLYVTGNIRSGSQSVSANAVNNAAVVAGAGIEYSKLEHLHHFTYRQIGRAETKRAHSVTFDIDNGAATTIDDVIMKPTAAVTVTAARVIYVTETAGTVAGANVKLGTTLGGAEIVAATNYTNSSTVGAQTSMSIVSGAVAAGGAVFVRHTGIAATVAGQAKVEVEYVDYAAGEVYDETIPLNIGFGASGTVLSIEAAVTTVPTSTRAHTIKLQKSTAGGAYSDILSADIEIDSSSVVRVAEAGTISTPGFIDGDTYQLVISSSGSGSNARGLGITVRASEDPS